MDLESNLFPSSPMPWIDTEFMGAVRAARLVKTERYPSVLGTALCVETQNPQSSLSGLYPCHTLVGAQ